ncbi:MAG: hypothetical protein M3220_14305 [Chloroflexota bacterium]|nr:hypothetical protein [Chloroflexota bacterium]
MSTINPTVIRSARRNRRYAIALLALAIVAVASLANGIYLRTQPVQINDLEAQAAVPAVADLTSERAADSYADQLDALRRQGQAATLNAAVPSDRPVDRYTSELDTLREQGQQAAQAGNTANRTPEGSVDQIADRYLAAKVRQLEQADGVQARATTRSARQSGGASLSAQERYQRVKAQQFEN